MHLLALLLRNPLNSIRFLYTFLAQSLIVFLRRLLLPHIPIYQSLRIQLQRAYMSSCSATFPDLTYRLPVGPVATTRAKRVGSDFIGYIIPGTKSLKPLTASGVGNTRCVALFAHGGGYARGEAKMYINYMERWERVAAEASLDLTFLSVEYPLTDKRPHPAQREAFLTAYQYLLDEGVSAKNIIFMGDSAGGGLCVLSGIECLRAGLPQPAGSVLLSPWMDMSMPAHEGGNALVETDYIVNANRVCPIYVARWLKDIPGTSPDVNPLYRQPAELEGLNPQLILVGAGEFALQESKDLAKLCNQAQVQHEIRCESGQLHVYALGSAWLDPAVRRRTDATVIDWMRSCLAQSHGQTNGVGQGKTKQSSLISA